MRPKRGGAHTNTRRNDASRSGETLFSYARSLKNFMGPTGSDDAVSSTNNPRR